MDCNNFLRVVVRTTDFVSTLMMKMMMMMMMKNKLPLMMICRKRFDNIYRDRLCFSISAVMNKSVNAMWE